jgi:hypothetical protein
MQKALSILSLVAVLGGTIGQTVSPFAPEIGQYIAAVGGIALIVTKPAVDVAEIIKKTFIKKQGQ